MSIAARGVDLTCLYEKKDPVLVLGYIRDKNGIGYSRDIGRSSIFAGRCYYIFGDTFCKNDRGDFVGISSNTIAVMSDKVNPLETKYLDIQEDGDKEGMVQEFIALNEDEKRRMRENNSRMVLWAWGGIAETQPEVGFIWYQKAEILSDKNHQYHGVGIARVSVGESKESEEPGRLSVCRLPGMMFQPDEPRVGTFSTLVHGHFIYLWGDDNQKGIILARVPTDYPNNRSQYRYWNGCAYVKNWRKAKQVLTETQHGQFFATSLFGSQYPWAFIGCSSKGDSQVLMGVGATLEGPWTLQPLFEAPAIDIPDQMRYCMYPHPWAMEESDGYLMITWSECWPGGVIGAKIKFTLGNSLDL